MGDFKFSYLNWFTHTLKNRTCIYSLDKDAVESIFQFMDEIILFQLVLIPTRLNNNILVPVLSKNSNNFNDITVAKVYFPTMIWFSVA